MANLNTVVTFLDTLLPPSLYHDASLNGLQVESDAEEITRVGLAVDSGLSIIKKAIEKKIQLLIVHHGLLWGASEKISGRLGEKIKTLIKGSCSLYASHLPLDGNLEVGNNAELARFFSLSSITAAFLYKGSSIGIVASTTVPTPREEFVIRSREMQGIKEPLFLPFGPPMIHKVAIISGSGVFGLEEAKRLGADLFISGEPKQEAYHLAQELQINALFAGHYATETFGVRALGRVLEERFSITPLFIDEPTGI